MAPVWAEHKIGNNSHVSLENRLNYGKSLWPLQSAARTVNETYEINADLDSYNYRSHVLLGLLRDQIARFACSAAVWTQTTDVEGEVNGLVTYDRRLRRVNATQWREDIQGLYDAADSRK